MPDSYTADEWLNMRPGTILRDADYVEGYSIMHWERIDDVHNYQLAGETSRIGWYEVYTDVTPPEIYRSDDRAMNRRLGSNLSSYEFLNLAPSLYDTIMAATA